MPPLETLPSPRVPHHQKRGNERRRLRNGKHDGIRRGPGRGHFQDSRRRKALWKARSLEHEPPCRNSKTVITYSVGWMTGTSLPPFRGERLARDDVLHYGVAEEGRRGLLAPPPSLHPSFPPSPCHHCMAFKISSSAKLSETAGASRCHVLEAATCAEEGRTSTVIL